jgi:glycosyltransferase involved in cell wall biosynthesis
MSYEFSVIIPTVHNLNGLRKLLDSLGKLEEIQKAEILIVENPPTGVASCLSVEFPLLNLRVLQSQAGVNRARNEGLHQSRGKLIFFLDDDCWVSNTEFFKIHKLAHQSYPEMFAIGGFYKNVNFESPLAKAYGNIQRNWLLSNRLDLTGECSALLGGHFSIKKSSKLPAFDENIKYGGAETEFFFRLKMNGYRFLLIDLSIEHEPKLTLFSLLRKARLQGKTHRRLVQDYHYRQEWLINAPTDIYENLYSFFFNPYDYKKFLVPLYRLKSQVKKIHHDVSFYLRNRDSF